MYCFRHIQNSSVLKHYGFSGIYLHIQSYSALLRYILVYWDIIKAYKFMLIQAYLAPYVTLA